MSQLQTGTVIKYFANRNFGFLRSDKDPTIEVYFKTRDIIRAFGTDKLVSKKASFVLDSSQVVGSNVSFFFGDSSKGACAIRVSIGDPKVVNSAQAVINEHVITDEKQGLVEKVSPPVDVSKFKLNVSNASTFWLYKSKIVAAKICFAIVGILDKASDNVELAAKSLESTEKPKLLPLK